MISGSAPKNRSRKYCDLSILLALPSGFWTLGAGWVFDGSYPASTAGLVLCRHLVRKSSSDEIAFLGTNRRPTTNNLQILVNEGAQIPAEPTLLSDNFVALSSYWQRMLAAYFLRSD
jgi:hypothetical protein